MSIDWKKIRESMDATPQFKEELRAQLYENAVFAEKKYFEHFIKKIEIPVSSLDLSVQTKIHPIKKIKQSMKNFHNFLIGLGRWVFVALGGAFIMLFIIPLISLFTSPPISASTKSYIYQFSGDGEIIRFRKKLSLKNEKEVFAGDIITTKSSSKGELIFFEGTSLRMDSDTTIKILSLNPKKGIFSTGGVELELKEGRIWVQNFHTQSKNSSFVITTHNSKVFPVRANVDIEYRGGKENIRVFENIAHIYLEGVFVDSDFFIKRNEEIFFTPFDEEVVVQDIPEKKSVWISQNLKRSVEYKREYVNNISAKLKEEFVIDEISAQIHTFISKDPTPQEMEEMIAQLNAFINPSEFSPHTKTKENYNISKNNNLEQDIDFIEEKTVFKTKGYKKNQYKKVSQKLKDIVHQKENVEESEDRDIKNTSYNENEKLQEKDEVKNAEEITINTIKTAKQVVEELRKEKFKKASENFSQQINTFKFRDSRRHHAQNILDKIPNTKENIELLKIMEKDAPSDVKRYIIKKRIKIERSLEIQ